LMTYDQTNLVLVVLLIISFVLAVVMWRYNHRTNERP